MLAVTAVVAALLYAVVSAYEKRSKEPVLRYEIVELKKPSDRKILEVPSMKIPGSSAIQCYAPATGEYLGMVNPTTPDGIDRAIEKAQTAQEKWAWTTFAKRRQVLRCIKTYILEHQEEICRVAALDSGKTLIDAMFGEILVTVEKLQWTIDHGEEALRPSRRPTNLLMMYKRNTVHYEPMGVVAALVSWNYPFHNLIGPVISSIFAGNGIIVKASENTAWSASWFSLIVKGALHTCGHDPHLVQVVTTWPQTANYLTSHPAISHITFIGSQPVAKFVAASAAKSLTPVCAELGGKDAAIVLNSAEKDLKRVTEILLRGTFQSAGQNCIGIERIIACPKVYDTLVTTMETRVRGIRVGSILDAAEGEQVDMGAMISDASFTRLEKLVQSAVADGARLLVGGSRYNHPVHHSGHYFQPTLLVDVTPDMEIAKEECFGPIMVLMRATSVTDALAIANAPNFGLGASVFGHSRGEISKVVKGLKTGMVAVNDFGAYYAVQMPFGGVRGSGYGRFAGEEGLRSVCNIKAVCEDRFGWAGISTAIPAQVAYPIPHTGKGFQFVNAIVEIGYGDLAEKGRGLKRMLKNL